MSLSLDVAVKNFLGFYVLTPFEQELLKGLSEALSPEEREILAYQLGHFMSVRRLIRHIDVPGEIIGDRPRFLGLNILP